MRRRHAQRTPVVIDFQKMREDSDRALRQQAAVEEAARARRIEFQMEADPISQLVKRCHAIDQRQDALDERITNVEQQVRTVINLLSEERANA